MLPSIFSFANQKIKQQKKQQNKQKMSPSIPCFLIIFQYTEQNKLFRIFCAFVCIMQTKGAIERAGP